MNWEWIILDDSPDDDHFEFLRENLSRDCRIRLYRRSENSGSIGNVKNEAVALCRGKYVLEMDHDDEILPTVLEDATIVFTKQGEKEKEGEEEIDLYTWISSISMKTATILIMATIFVKDMVLIIAKNTMINGSTYTIRPILITSHYHI